MPTGFDIVQMQGKVRGLSIPGYNDQDQQIPAENTRGEWLMAQALPELTELVRQGGSWQVALTAGLAALTALPTTTAGLSLWNGNPTGGQNTPVTCFAIDAIGSVEEVIDATQADTTAIFACNNIGPIAAVTDSGVTVHGLSGNRYAGMARTVSAATVVNDGWYGHGQQPPLAPAVAGANWKINEVLLRGLYLVKPSGQFNIVAVKAGAAAAAQQFYFIRWHEVLLTAR